MGRKDGWIWCSYCAGKGQVLDNFGVTDSKGLLVVCDACDGEGFWRDPKAILDDDSEE